MTITVGLGFTPALPDPEHLSLAEQVAQMLVVRAAGYLFDHQIQYPAWEPTTETLQHWVQDFGVGGVILLGGSAGELALRSQQLQSWAKIPLLLAADIEEGVGQRFAGATWFPPPMALAAIARQDPAKARRYAEQMGACIAQEALSIGLNWLLAPVVDVNNNPDNPVINVRAFGETPEQVSQLAIAFLQGVQRYPVLTAAKHFPGHGDTASDSHLELPVLSHSWDRLREIELPPFTAVIAAGVDAVMSAHLQIPALDPERPVTLSPPILTQLLRQKLGFAGLVVTDALVMGAITQRYGSEEAAVLAVEAGADIILMPVDPPGAIRAIYDAVRQGRISLEQIRASLERIWRAKHKVCFPIKQIAHPSPLIQLGQLAQPQTTATAAQILRDAMQVYCPTCLRPEIGTESHLRNLILVDDSLNCNFLHRQAPAIALPQQMGYKLQLVDSHTPSQPLDLSADVPGTLVQLFIRGNPFRDSAGLTQVAQNWLQALVKVGQLQALVVYGSPYTLEQLLPLPPALPYVFTYGQMPAAQAIALEALFDLTPLVQSTRSLEIPAQKPFTD